MSSSLKGVGVLKGKKEKSYLDPGSVRSYYSVCTARSSHPGHNLDVMGPLRVVTSKCEDP